MDPNADSGDDVGSYIYQKALDYGIDPRVATRVAQSEGLNAFSPDRPDHGGDGGSSFGPFQLHYGGVNPNMPHAGLGDDFTKATGLDARDPSTWKQQVDFALQHASKSGWSAWMGAAKSGVSNYDGIGGSPAPSAPDLLSQWNNGVKSAGSAAPPAQAAEPDLLSKWNAANTIAHAVTDPAQGTAKTQTPQAEPPGAMTSPGGGLAVMNSMPIVGHGILAAGAGINSLINGDSYASERALQSQQMGDFATQHPYANTGAQVAGGVLGTVPAMMAAPAAFGVGAWPLAARMAASGVGGAAIGGADSAIRTGGDPTAALHGAEFGGAFGAAGPLAGRAIGAGVDYASNALTRTTPAARNVASALSAIGMTPQDAQAALTRMGPNATLADIDPALTAEAGGLAQTGGSATSILRNAMAARGAGSDDRVSQAVSTALGPRPDISAVKEGIVSDAQKAASPFYDAARSFAQPMDATPVLSSIDGQLKTAAPKGGEAAVLNKVRGFLTQDVVAGPNGEQMTVPQDDPQALLKARQEVDGMIDGLQRNGSIDGTTAGKNAYRTAVNVRGQIDGLLKSDPNIAAGDAAFATKMGQKDALDEGADLLKPGTRVEDVARSVAAKTPEEQDAMRQGALSTIHDSLDNARQGDLSAARSLFAKSTANRAKLDALFPNSGQLFDSLDSEIAQRGTENVVRSGSQTAANQAIRNKYSPPASGGGASDLAAPLIGDAIYGGPGAVALTGAQRIFNSLRSEYTNATLSRLREGTARGLSSTGTEQGNFLGQIGRAYRSSRAANALSNGSDEITNLLMRSLAAPTQNALSAH